MTTPTTVVIGGGIVGVSIAEALARKGASVTLIERNTIGSGTTSTSYAWVNSNGKEPEPYYAINAAGIRAHREFAGDSTAWFRQTGHLEVSADESHERDVIRRSDALLARGYPAQKLSPDEAQELEPGLILPDSPRTIMFYPDEGHVDPLLYTAKKLSLLIAAGGDVREHTEVTGIESHPDGSTVRLADGSALTADRVVVAAGRWSSDVAALAGGTVPLASFESPGDVTVGYLLRTNPLPVSISRPITSPWLNIRPDGAGRLLIQALDLDATADPGNVPNTDSELAETYLERLRAVMRFSDGARIDELLVGQRVMPADGKTICGPVPDAPGLYAVATHSGVTLAPFLGDAVAGEILGEEEPLLEAFRLDRFAGDAPVVLPRGPRKPGEQ